MKRLPGEAGRPQGPPQRPPLGLPRGSPGGLGRTRPGAIILARHGEPALSRKVRLSSAGYRAWWQAYEAGGLKADQPVPDGLACIARDAGHMICSTRPRSRETAAALSVTLAADRAVVEDARFIEAPLPPPALPGWIRLSPRAWGFIARFWWWFFNHHQGEESRGEARVRAADAARRLVELAGGGDDVLVVAHGFFNGMVGGALKRLGWRCVDDGGFRYWSARRFEARESLASPSGEVER